MCRVQVWRMSLRLLNIKLSTKMKGKTKEFFLTVCTYIQKKKEFRSIYTFRTFNIRVLKYRPL